MPLPIRILFLLLMLNPDSLPAQRSHAALSPASAELHRMSSRPAELAPRNRLECNGTATGTLSGCERRAKSAAKSVAWGAVAGGVIAGAAYAVSARSGDGIVWWAGLPAVTVSGAAVGGVVGWIVHRIRS